jgi:hypothetical protein
MIKIIKFPLLVFFVFPGILHSCSVSEAPSLTTSPVTDITATSATCGGTVTKEGSGPIIERGICWNTERNPSLNNDKKIESGGIGKFISNLSGLSPSTTYYVRAYATNSAGISYGNELSFTTSTGSFPGMNHIIADHNIVDRYDDIPAEYIAKVKKMMVFLGGLSHAKGYRVGLELLEKLNTNYQVLTFSSEPVPPRSDDYLRFGQPFNWGEQMYTSESYVSSMKGHITGQNTKGNAFDVVGLGWCYTMHWVNPVGGTEDPVHKVRWAGSSDGGPEGNKRWGLDSDDQILTGNSICMDTYLKQVDDYNAYFKSHNVPTIVIFTTGPVDNEDAPIAGTETGFQRELKHDHIRAYVAADESRILFDYADILCWNNSGEKYTANWNDNGTLRSHANIHPDNVKDYDSSWNVIAYQGGDYHIGEVGCLRIAKAMWWMLARIAGWDGN